MAVLGEEPISTSVRPAPAPHVPSSQGRLPDAGRLLVAGRWMPGLGQASVTDPWTGRECARVAQAGPRELEQALEGARLAAPRMAREPRHRRASLLAEISRLITRDRETLARLITAEAGKPIRFSKLEVERAARTFAIAATEARQSLATPWAADAEPGAENFVARTERFPLGPVVAITPFNFPLNLVAHKVAPALAAGNPVIVKPAPQAPSAALHLGRLVMEAGAPEGAISVVPCGPEMAQGLATDGRVRMLSFTGSAEVGWKLRSLAAGKRCVLELGGNAAAIVHHDADLEWVAERLALGAFLYAGQVCISVQRILVERSVYRRFSRLFSHATQDLAVGDPSDPATIVGPMIDHAARTRVEDWIREARGSGGRTLAGGERRGELLSPTIMEDVPANARLNREEVFGPVAVLGSFDAFDDAIAQVNASPYGLQAAVFTHDERRIEAAFRGLEVGAVIVNDYPTLRFDHLPYGGVKVSGQGREGVRNAMLEMTEERLLLTRLLTESEAPMPPPPVIPERVTTASPWSTGPGRASAHDVELDEGQELAIEAMIDERAANGRPENGSAPRAEDGPAEGKRGRRRRRRGRRRGDAEDASESASAGPGSSGGHEAGEGAGEAVREEAPTSPPEQRPVPGTAAAPEAPVKAPPGKAPPRAARSRARKPVAAAPKTAPARARKPKASPAKKGASSAPAAKGARKKAVRAPSRKKPK